MKSNALQPTPAPLRALLKIDAGIQFNAEARDIVVEAWEGRDIVAPLAAESRRTLLAATIISALLARAQGETAFILAPTLKEAQRIFRALHAYGAGFHLSGICLQAETLIAGGVRQNYDFVVTTASLFTAVREPLSGFLPRVSCLVLCGYERLRNLSLPFASIKQHLGPAVQTIIALDDYEPETYDFEDWSSAPNRSHVTFAEA